MKKSLALLAAVIILIGLTGCKVQLSDAELLEQAYANMETLELVHSQAEITISMMGMTMDPIKYEILSENPDKTYMKMDMDLLDTGQVNSIEILMQGEDIRFRSDLLDEMDTELREMMEASIAAEMENPQEYEDMFLEVEEMSDFEVVENPDGLDAQAYTTYKFTLTNDQLHDMMAEAMELGEDFMPPEAEEMDHAELAEVQAMIEEMLNNLEVTMDALLVVDNEAKNFHSLEMAIDMNFPFPDFTGTAAGPEILSMDYSISIDYLEINTELDFPSFE